MRYVAARIRRRLSSEQGFTLIELLVSTVIGAVVMLAAFGLLDSTIGAFGSAQDRTDVASRGRLAMDSVIQRLRSPICLDANGTSAVISADSTSISFWSDTTGSDFRTGNAQPVVRELSISNGVLTERTRATVGGAVTRERPVATGLTQIGTTAYFRYWKLSASTTPPRQANVALTVPVAAADLASVARISVSFTVNPRSGGDAKHAAQFQNDVYIRAIDYSSPLGVIRCTSR